MAEEGTDGRAPRADLNLNFTTPVPLGATLTGRIASSAPASYIARPEILFNTAGIGTTPLRRLRLSAIRGHSSTTASPLRIRLDSATRARIRSLSRSLHHRPILGVKLNGTFDTGAEATQHYREFVVTP